MNNEWEKTCKSVVMRKRKQIRCFSNARILTKYHRAKMIFRDRDLNNDWIYPLWSNVLSNSPLFSNYAWWIYGILYCGRQIKKCRESGISFHHDNQICRNEFQVNVIMIQLQPNPHHQAICLKVRVVRIDLQGYLTIWCVPNPMHNSEMQENSNCNVWYALAYDIWTCIKKHTVRNESKLRVALCIFGFLSIMIHVNNIACRNLLLQR